MPILIHVNIKNFNHLEASGDFSFQLGIRNEEFISADMSAIYKTCIEIKLILGDLENE